MDLHDILSVDEQLAFVSSQDVAGANETDMSGAPGGEGMTNAAVCTGFDSYANH